MEPFPSNFKEILWPPNGFVYDQEYMLPAFCKPKLCPLKSNMDLDKKRQEALDKLKEIERRELEIKAETKTINPENINPQTDIWKADEDETK